MLIWSGYSFFNFLDRLFKGIYLSKALTCMKIFLYKQELLFVKETDTFGHIVVWTTYTSLIDHFTPQHTAYRGSYNFYKSPTFMHFMCFSTIILNTLDFLTVTVKSQVSN